MLSELISTQTGSIMLAISPIVVILIAAWQSRKTRQHLIAIKDEVSTNHGRRAFEYLEMIPYVIASIEAVKKNLSDHTTQDAENFSSINRQINDFALAATRNDADARMASDLRAATAATDATAAALAHAATAPAPAPPPVQVEATVHLPEPGPGD